MTKDLTFSHALSKIKKLDLKEMLVTYTDESRVDPNALKSEIVETLSSLVPENEKEKIIDTVFNTPNTRYTAYLAEVSSPILISEEEIKSKFTTYNSNSTFKGFDFEKSDKQQLDFINQEDKEYIFMFTRITKSPHFDPGNMTSSLVSYQRKVRVVVNKDNNRVIIYTGDRNIFNSVLSALTISLGIIFKSLDVNKAGISENLRSSFTFDTVKFIDFIYNGLTRVGKISEVNQIKLETNNAKKSPQKVKVEGDMLLTDKNICVYLYLRSRNIVGIKVDLILEINEISYSISCDIEIKDNRIKIGIRKDKYSIDDLKIFFGLIEDAFYDKISSPGLIDEEKTRKYLNDIKITAIKDN